MTSAEQQRKTSAPVGIAIAAPPGLIRLRRERRADPDFLFALFSASRPDGEALGAVGGAPLLRLQFEAHAANLRTRFPGASRDIIELSGEAAGRLTVDRPGDKLHILDIAIVPHLRNHGIGTAVLRRHLEEARAARLPVRLAVAVGNAAALRLYRRLDFVPVGQWSMHIELEWRPSPDRPR